MTTKFPCRVEGCGKPASPGYFLCPKHYVAVPGAIQRELKRAWRDHDHKAYAQARQAAVNHLNPKHQAA